MLFIKLFFILLSVSSLYSHQTGLSFLDIKEHSNSKIELTYKIPLQDTQADEISILYPSHCSISSIKQQSISNGYIIEKSSLYCAEVGLKKSRIWVEGFLKNDKGVLIRYENNELIQSSLLRATTPYILIDIKESKLDVFKGYFELGVVHILLGYDHLLFVLCLILLVTNLKILLYSVTAFTLSHSITLAFGILNIVSVPIAYVEAMIALSILFLARELIITNKNSFTTKHLGLVTFIFGLLHGFGFSSVLTDIGLPQDEIPLALFSFNVGIEAGQLIFIAFAGSIILMIKKYLYSYYGFSKKVIAYIVGSLAGFWLFERVLAF